MPQVGADEHTPVFTKSRGKIHVRCTCGVNLTYREPVRNEDQARELHAYHVLDTWYGKGKFS